jgi:hypothetical protein
MTRKYQPRIGDTAIARLRKEWGDNYERRVETARRLTAPLGPEKIDELEEQLGTTALFESAFAVANHVRGTIAPQTAERAIRAHAAIERARHDEAFTKELLSGSSRHRDLWDRLHEEAFPEPADD